MAGWQDLAPWYAVTFWISGVNISEYVDPASVSIKDTGGLELETCSFTMRHPALAEPYEWREIQVFLDKGTVGEQCVFAGYVTRDKRAFSASGVDVLHDIRCEGYKTLLERSKPFSASWILEQFSRGFSFVEDMLTTAGLTEFTVEPPVVHITGHWSKDLDESIGKNIDRFCKENNWRWRVTWDKKIIAGPEGADPAPFGLSEGAEADFSALYPVDRVEYEQDGSSITNAVLLIGGTAISDIQTDTFTGDGVIDIFSLDVHPVAEIIQITLDGVFQSWGTLGYHNCVEREVLVNFESGFIKFCTAPALNAAVACEYTFAIPYTYEGHDTSSESDYGRSLWDVVTAPHISDDTAAAVYVASVFANRAYSPKRVSTTCRRAGIRAGQTVPVCFPRLGIGSGTELYTDAVGISLDSSRRVRFELNLSPPGESLSQTIESLVKEKPMPASAGSAGSSVFTGSQIMSDVFWGLSDTAILGIT